MSGLYRNRVALPSVHMPGAPPPSFAVITTSLSGIVTVEMRALNDVAGPLTPYGSTIPCLRPIAVPSIPTGTSTGAADVAASPGHATRIGMGTANVTGKVRQVGLQTADAGGLQLKKPDACAPSSKPRAAAHARRGGRTQDVAGANEEAAEDAPGVIQVPKEPKETKEVDMEFGIAEAFLSSPSRAPCGRETRQPGPELPLEQPLAFDRRLSDQPISAAAPQHSPCLPDTAATPPPPPPLAPAPATGGGGGDEDYGIYDLFIEWAGATTSSTSTPVQGDLQRHSAPNPGVDDCLDVCGREHHDGRAENGPCHNPGEVVDSDDDSAGDSGGGGTGLFHFRSIEGAFEGVAGRPRKRPRLFMPGCV